MTTFRKCNLYYDPEALDFLVEYGGDFKGQIDKVNYACGEIITESIGIIYVYLKDVNRLLKDVPAINFIEVRRVFVLQDISPTSVDNINSIKINPYLDLSGNGVVIGIVDTGIDYLNQEFVREDGTSRIINIWDQSIVRDNTNASNVYIGSVYSNEQINAAIVAANNKQDPYSIVPSKDEIGHGTRMAGIIGARGYTGEFQGIAHDSEFVVVKLRESPNYRRRLEKNGVNIVPTYNGSEVIAALEYLRTMYSNLKRPMVIYLGVGSTEGSHDGTNFFSRYVSSLGSIRGLCAVVGTGNEGASQGHVSGFLKGVGDMKAVELSIPVEIKTFTMYIWVQKPNRASLNVISPTGEESKVIQSKSDKEYLVKFIFVNTNMSVRYYTPEYYTGHELIRIEFTDIKPGIWTLQLIGVYVTNGRFDIWLPPSETLPPNTVFLNPDPYNTLTMPSDAINVVTPAFSGLDNSVIATSGKGFNTNGLINPDIITVGVDVLTTNVGGGKTTVSGSSVATAIVVGACALLLEWGIVDGNDTTMYTKKVRSYLMYGAARNEVQTYPNRESGYGELDLLGTFNIISKSSRYIVDTLDKDVLISECKTRKVKYYKFIEFSANTIFFRIPKHFYKK
ncbi:S8 family peptidase [Clostridium cellulovorans]|uniref:Peptidase S8 and S53 subtilisin kexin sedolisin n=1 Tax=Clostridium cellulovorans (strain ATCC 35296 / DSM 3052 / OCM 3 / 743B) TaxID=573061 RepID=D9SMW1_CLOC7|nr:S8 family peptidase [Clostridium cellulovorans]ADL51827.1 peptidase S8 and S53 subtilisin kexin sedolisin [Clostridium cellulovorans 743B]